MNLSPQVEELFHLLADLDQHQQALFFQEHPVDPAIRSTVETLLASDVTAGSRLSRLISYQADASLNAAGDLAQDSVCGPYRLRRLIARGGMGEVWLADRTDGLLKRPVALKLSGSGAFGAHFAERLRRERDILAGLAHPGIARIYDAGIAEGGRPFLALEFVEGASLLNYCDERRLSVGGRLGLFLQILSAVQYAHSRLVIHRDLKPSNILVTGAGEVKLLDFGIAKLMTQEGPSETELTQLGGRAFTLPYASPEQVLGQTVTTSSDVFSLGTILCELLSGARPFIPRNESRGAFEEAILNADPRRASQAVTENRAERCSTTPRKLRASLQGDLDQIILRALQKQPENRYLTVDAFRADIERHLAGDPVQAQPESTRYRVKKFVLRHRLAVVSAAAIFLALAAGLSLALWQAGIARQEARTAQAVQEFTEDIFRTNSLEQPDPVKARQTSARELLDIGARKISSSLKDAPAAKARMLSILGGLYLDLGLDDQAVVLQKQRVAVLKALYGPRNVAVVRALIALSGAMHASRAVHEREAVLLEGKAILDANGDRSSETRALLLDKLAQHYESLDVPKSISLAVEALSIYRKFPPSGNLGGALYRLALSQLLAGNLERAESELTEAISISRKFDGDPNSSLARYYAYLAQAQQDLMHYDAAEVSYRAAVKYAHALGSADDVDTLQTESRLGQFLAATSRSRDALSYLERVKDACLRTRGPDDPFYLPQMLIQYGMALEFNGQPEAALDNISRAVENRRKNRPGTRYLGQMLEDQALILIELGHNRRAGELLEEAAAIRKAVGQKYDSNYSLPRVELALALGKTQEAADWVERYYGPAVESSPLKTDYLKNLGWRAEIALLQKDGSKAVAMARRALDALAASPNQKYLGTQQARALFQEGRGYLIENNAAQALPSLERSAQIYMDLQHPASPNIARVKAALGTCYLMLGNRQKSRDLLGQSLSVMHAHKELGDFYLRPVQELAGALVVTKVSQ